MAKAAKIIKDLPQAEVQRHFIRIPTWDYAGIETGFKREFRTFEARDRELIGVELPLMVIGFCVPAAEKESIWDHCRRTLLVLEKTWREPLGSISLESANYEGFADVRQFREYWREKRDVGRFDPLMEVTVYRVRPFEEHERDFFAQDLLRRLYGPELA